MRRLKEIGERGHGSRKEKVFSVWLEIPDRASGRMMLFSPPQNGRLELGLR